MRLIDADALMKCIPREEYGSRFAVANAPTVEVVGRTCEFWDAESNFCALHRPSAQPTADVVERKKGKWTEKEVIYKEEAKDIVEEWQSCRCSICGHYNTQPYMYYFKEPNFCAVCGADMRGGTDG